MGTVGSLFPTTTNSNAASGVTGTSNSGSSSSAASSSSSSNSSSSLASQSTFLQLLVAQLQNQDPTQPVDGTTFVTQLATFTDVEQNLGTRQDLDAVSQKYLGTTTPPSDSTSSTGGGADSSSSSGTSALANSIL